MNTPNNKRKRDSQLKIEKIFRELIQTKEIQEITVTEICQKAQLNRTTFYANYIDIYDLAEKIKIKLEQEVAQLYSFEKESLVKDYNFLKLFEHIKDNQLFYKTYFKLGFDNKFILTQYDYKQALDLYDDKYIDYHIEFFRTGLNAVIKKWLNNNCQETPQEIFAIIKDEYERRL